MAAPFLHIHRHVEGSLVESRWRRLEMGWRMAMPIRTTTEVEGKAIGTRHGPKESADRGRQRESRSITPGLVRAFRR